MNVGDKITVAGYAARTSYGEPPVHVLARAHVVCMDSSTGEFTWTATRGDIDCTATLSSAYLAGAGTLAEQGSRWVEGWPPFDSLEISALRSAWMLAPGYLRTGFLHPDTSWK